MNEIQHGIDINKLCDIKGPIHVSFVDVNNIIVACNQSRLDFYRDVYGVENAIGRKPCEIIGSKDQVMIDHCYNENVLVMAQKKPRQSYQTSVIKDRYRLDLLTFKMPIFASQGEMMGVLTISHFINKFSADKAFQLGFSKREAECLFYLIEGSTAKEIAVILKLSYRTVEGYIDNMKNKAGCSTTTELLLHALQNEINENVYNQFSFAQNNKLNPLSDALDDTAEFSIRTEDLNSQVLDTGEHATLTT